MEKNLYIDASHPNETRVVLKSNYNIEDLWGDAPIEKYQS